MLLLKHLQIMGKILTKMYLAIVWEESSMVWMALSLWPGSMKQATKSSSVAGWSLLCSSNL
jgi:hypothetical protein